MKVILMAGMEDMQTGVYIFESFLQLGHEIEYIDVRKILRDKGFEDAQRIITKLIDTWQYEPDIVMTLKGLELSMDTLKYMKDKWKTTKFINWFFDVKAGATDAWENKEYREYIKLFDYFFCSLEGVALKLQEQKHDNVYWLPEACYPELNGEVYMNNFQKKKYGNDVVFVGTIGLTKFHPNRIPILTKIAQEGFDLKVYGQKVCDWKEIPVPLRDSITEQTAVNQQHSLVAKAGLINVGIDQEPQLSKSYSARIYRALCAGGMYTCPYVRDIEKEFKINERFAPITKDLEIVCFYDEQDMIDKLDFLLEHDDIREAIALNGQKAVMEKHKFTDRLTEMINIIGEK